MRFYVCVAATVFSALCASLAAETPIIFAEYNVQNWVLMDRSHEGKKRRTPKSAQSKAVVIESISAIQPDILGVEEMGDSVQAEDFRKRLREAGMDYPYMELVEGADKERHVLLLSKFPIAERNSQSNVRFTMDGKPAHMQRGILDVTIQVRSDYQLRVLGVHLKSRREAHGYSEALLRSLEAHELRKYVEGILKFKPDSNLLLFGDFNDTKNTPPIKEIIGLRGTSDYLEDIYLNDSEGDRWTYYWAWEDEYSRIDYLF
ncbi:MAG: endonuclease/exonuclease/phosphatase family protein, partial [Chthoniobacterales bacterium]